MADLSRGLSIGRSTLWMLCTLAGCATGQRAQATARAYDPVAGGRIQRGGDLHGMVSDAGASRATAPEKVSAPDAPVDAGDCSTPPTLNGTLVHHCAYGIPTFGEDPKVDARETPWMLVLDMPIDIRVHEYGSMYRCYRSVRMMQ